MDDLGGDSPEDLREMLRRSEERRNSIDWRAYSAERFASFSRPERLAITRYLLRDGLCAGGQRAIRISFACA
ncbi:MAG: hypothetical protein IT210_18930 [Armatimonadetes bacterium]|nr:hypothetical protein [Armatimonadota bacterium]